MVTFTTQQFAWKNIRMYVNGVRFRQFTEIEYEREVEREYIYGEGDEPQAIQDGNKTYAGKIMVLQSELEALVAAAPNRDILEYGYFDIVVKYEAENAIVIDVLKNCKFTKFKKGMKQGDKKMEVELPIMFTSIK